MTLATHVYEATLLIGAGHPLDLVGGAVTLDDSWAPHVQAQLVLGMPDPAVLDLLDPRTQPRVQVTATVTYHPLTPAPEQVRVFNLVLVDRDLDHGPGQVSISLASDEALLQDDTHRGTAPDTSAKPHQTSLRAIIDQAILSRIGAALEPGTADASCRVLWTATGNIANGFLRTAAAGWKFGNGTLGDAARVAVSNPPEPGIGFCASVTGLSAGTNRGLFYQGGITGTGVPVAAVSPGNLYHARAWVRTNAAVPVTLSLEWANSSGATIGTTVGPEVTTTAGLTEWVLVTVSGTAPAGAARVGPYCYTRAGYSAPAGLSFQLCGLTGTASEYAPDECWDGNTTDTAEYAYQWAGAVSASNPTRTALIDRSPNVLDWEPGRSAWSFIQPLFQAAGFRLFCDEQRRWQLVDGAEFMADGHLQLSYGRNLTAARDRITREGDSGWYDAAQVIYTWTDSTATRQVRYDHYAEPGATKTRVFNLDTPYPGPGFARYLVRRALGRGRVLEVGAVSQFTVTPSQAITVTLPDTPIQVGQVSRVSFDLTTGAMRVATRGLTDTTPDAWVFGPAATDWDDLSADMDWVNFAW